MNQQNKNDVENGEDAKQTVVSDSRHESNAHACQKKLAPSWRTTARKHNFKSSDNCHRADDILMPLLQKKQKSSDCSPGLRTSKTVSSMFCVGQHNLKSTRGNK